MSNFFKKAKTYEQSSDQHFENAYTSLGMENELLFNPYFNSSYHTSSLVYPLCHFVKAFIAAGRIFQGTFLLVESLFNDDFQETSASIVTGLGNELLTLVLDMAHAIVSTLALISRTVSSLINGYAENTLKNSLNVDNPLVVFQLPNMVEILANGFVNNVAEEALYQSTTQLSI